MPFRLTKEQEDHLARIQVEFSFQVWHKYCRGAEEHGGDLRDMTLLQLVDNAIDEAIDQFVFLLTLRDKMTANLK